MINFLLDIRRFLYLPFLSYQVFSVTATPAVYATDPVDWNEKNTVPAVRTHRMRNIIDSVYTTNDKRVDVTNLKITERHKILPKMRFSQRAIFLLSEMNFCLTPEGAQTRGTTRPFAQWISFSRTWDIPNLLLHIYIA